MNREEGKQSFGLFKTGCSAVSIASLAVLVCLIYCLYGIEGDRLSLSLSYGIPYGVICLTALGFSIFLMSRLERKGWRLASTIFVCSVGAVYAGLSIGIWVGFASATLGGCSLGVSACVLGIGILSVFSLKEAR